METKDWLLFLGPLLGVITGGLITTVLKFVELGHQRRRDDQRRLLEKLEELHLLVCGFGAKFAAEHSHLVRGFMTGKTAVERSEAFNKYSGTMNGEVSVITSLLYLYAPEAGIFWSMVLQEHMDFTKRTAEVFAGEKNLKDLLGYVRKISSSAAMVRSAIEAKIEKQRLVTHHEKTGFSEILELTFAKRWAGLEKLMKKQKLEPLSVEPNTGENE